VSKRERPWHYVLDGRVPRPVHGVMAWAQWFETADRRVARTVMLDGSEVSTVFLGLDHSFGDGPPQLFETCVFLHEDTEPGTVSRFASGRTLQASEVTQRYATWAEAEVGHMELCEQLTAALAEWRAKATP
jgi:hypothetical protein